ncbi:hypothetical protein D3C86_2061370 [compost metagenome]
MNESLPHQIVHGVRERRSFRSSSALGLELMIQGADKPLSVFYPREISEVTLGAAEGMPNFMATLLRQIGSPSIRL